MTALSSGISSQISARLYTINQWADYCQLMAGLRHFRRRKNNGRHDS